MMSTVFNWIRNNSDAYNINSKNIVLFGHSTGGTIATYSGAVDDNIPAVVASGSIGFIKIQLVAVGIIMGVLLFRIY